MQPRRDLLMSRRAVVAGLAVSALAGLAARGRAQGLGTDATFLFISDVHACRMEDGLSPECREQGKTDENLLRHIRGINAIEQASWPAEIGGRPTGLASAGQRVRTPLGIVVGGDMTDDGGGQRALPGEGTQLMQFSQRYSQGSGGDRVNFPVYAGLGNTISTRTARRAMSNGTVASCGTMSR